MKTIPCRVKSITGLTHNVFHVTLETVSGRPMTFDPGQYLEILFGAGERSAFSIAQKPSADERIELHILRDPLQGTSIQVLQHLRQNSVIEIFGPLGTCTLIESIEGAINILAAGTGFSQAKSLLEAAFQRARQTPLRLYWGVRTAADFYHQDLIRDWQRTQPNFKFIPVVEKDSNWTGAQGVLGEVFLQQGAHEELGHLYLSGSPAMVYACVDLLDTHQLMDQKRTYSDVFTYAPRLELK